MYVSIGFVYEGISQVDVVPERLGWQLHTFNLPSRRSTVAMLGRFIHSDILLSSRGIRLPEAVESLSQSCILPRHDGHFAVSSRVDACCAIAVQFVRWPSLPSTMSMK